MALGSNPHVELLQACRTVASPVLTSGNVATVVLFSVMTFHESCYWTTVDEISPIFAGAALITSSSDLII
jgi:hypothetical protein